MLTNIVHAIYTGVFTVIIGLALHVILGYHAKHAESPTMKQEMIDLIILLFLTGTISCIIYDMLGITKFFEKYKMIGSVRG